MEMNKKAAMLILGAAAVLSALLTLDSHVLSAGSIFFDAADILREKDDR